MAPGRGCANKPACPRAPILEQNHVWSLQPFSRGQMAMWVMGIGAGMHMGAGLLVHENKGL